MKAQPDRDIDSTPQAIPTFKSPAMIAWLIWTVALTDEPQNRLIVAAAALSGKPAATAAHRATSPIPSWATLTQPATMSSGYPNVFTGTAHRHPQQIIKPQMQQRSPLARERCTRPAKYECISHICQLSEGTSANPGSPPSTTVLNRTRVSRRSLISWIALSGSAVTSKFSLMRDGVTDPVRTAVPR